MASALTLFRDAELFDPAPRGRSDLLVGGERLLAVLPQGSSAASGRGAGGAGAWAFDASLCEVIDLGGARVIPGLVDSHVHVTGGGGESGPSSRVPRVALSELARGGVTTCVGVLGTDGTTRSVEELVATTLGLREEGLSAYCWTGSYEVPPITLTGSVRGDVVFVDPVVGAGEIAISDHRSSQPTLDELARLAADCHVAGLMSGKAGILHLHLGDGPRGLSLVQRLLDETELPPRVFHPTHVNRQPKLFEEAIGLARRGVTIDVTAFPTEDGDPAIPAADAILAYLASGAPREHLTCSSDGGGCLPSFDRRGLLVSMDVGRPSALAETLAELLRRGAALEDVLPVFTSNVTALLRMADKGTLRPGAAADLVVLDGAHRVRDVMARGRFLVRDGAPVARGLFEEELAPVTAPTDPPTERPRART